MVEIRETGVRSEGTQYQVPMPPGSEGYRTAPGPQPGSYPPPGGWYGPQPGYYIPQEPRRSSKPRIVGILLMFSGVIAIIFGTVAGGLMLNWGPMSNFIKEMQTDTGEIQGEVIFMNSSPAADVNVTIVDLNKVATTNATGHYRLLGVPVGWHDLKAEKSGYTTLLKRVYVKGESRSSNKIPVTESDFQLQPGTGEQKLADEGDDDLSRMMPFMQSIGGVCLVVGIVCGSLAILGGYFAMQRTKLPIVVLGTVCGIISIGFALSTILSVVALILLLLCTDEFDREKKATA